jgi:hypothetical protein
MTQLINNIQGTGGRPKNLILVTTVLNRKQKATKCMQIVKETGIIWHEERLIRKLYRDQSVKAPVDQAERSSVKIGKRVI